MPFTPAARALSMLVAASCMRWLGGALAPTGDAPSRDQQQRESHDRPLKATIGLTLKNVVKGRPVESKKGDAYGTEERSHVSSSN
jgi:hypothetical protein